MTRIFIQHDLRQVLSLNGIWDFIFLGDVDLPQITELKFKDLMPVPGCFDATPTYAGYRGHSGLPEDSEN